jgi:uncharacterized membrane protein YedE/YeeE
MEMITMPLVGGILIGIASSIVLFGLGKVAGVSGVFASSFLSKHKHAEKWKYFFIFGLILGGVIMKVISPELFEYEFLGSLPLTVVAGLLVGFGTRLGSGCTSGHGVCGLPRKSARSFVATCTFILFGIITVYFKGIL